MERKNGFIDLDRYYKKNYSELVQKGIIKPICRNDDDPESPKKKHNWITIDGQDYFIKESSYWQTELVAEEFSKLLGFQNIHYDIAKLDGVEYVISENYKKNGYKYYTGYEIMKPFYKDVLKNDANYFTEMGLTRKDSRSFDDIYYLNNLQMIWQGLEFGFRDRPDRETIVRNIITELKRRFFLKTIIVFDADYHVYNWEIEDGKDISLVPNFDNESAFISDIYGLPFGVDINDVGNGVRGHLVNFLKVSSKEDFDELKVLVEKAIPELLLQAVRKVEERIGVTLNRKYVNDITLAYINNYEKINIILEMYRGINGR